jgi:hypothetical protein
MQGVPSPSGGIRPIPTTPAAALFDDRLSLVEAQLHELEPLYLTGSYVDG